MLRENKEPGAANANIRLNFFQPVTVHYMGAMRQFTRQAAEKPLRFIPATRPRCSRKPGNAPGAASLINHP